MALRINAIPEKYRSENRFCPGVPAIAAKAGGNTWRRAAAAFAWPVTFYSFAPLSARHKLSERQAARYAARQRPVNKLPALYAQAWRQAAGSGAVQKPNSARMPA